MPRSYSLNGELDAFIEARIQTGQYHDAAQVIADALSLLEEREQLRDIDVARLRDFVSEGRASGLSPHDGETVLDRLEAKYRSRAGGDSPD